MLSLGRERAVARDEEHVGIGEELDRVERAVRHGEAAEPEVDGAALDAAVERLVVGRLRQLEGDPGPVAHEPAHHEGEDARADRLVRRDPQRARLAGAQRGHVRARRIEPVDDRLGVSQQQVARLGHRDRTRAAGALDELLPDDALEGGDLLAHRRLGVAELEGGAAERAGPGHGLECRQVPHLDAEPVVGAAVGESVGG